jgi:hypothetical protein
MAERIGPAGCCLHTTTTDETTPVMRLNVGEDHPVTISHWSGCALVYNRHFDVYLENSPKGVGSDKASWERVHDLLAFQRTVHDCVPDHDGHKCVGVCGSRPGT